MSKNAAVLRRLLLGGAVYFLAVSAAHMLDLKVPMLFVYYSLPSYAYQDKIISFLSFGWAVFLFLSAVDPLQNRAAVKAVITAGLVAVFGLHVINHVTDFKALAPDADPSVFRKETFLLGAYETTLIIFYFLTKKRKGD